jgi:hypothetical protein
MGLALQSEFGEVEGPGKHVQRQIRLPESNFVANFVALSHKCNLKKSNSHLGSVIL